MRRRESRRERDGKRRLTKTKSHTKKEGEIEMEIEWEKQRDRREIERVCNDRVTHCMKKSVVNERQITKPLILMTLIKEYLL